MQAYFVGLSNEQTNTHPTQRCRAQNTTARNETEHGARPHRRRRAMARRRVELPLGPLHKSGLIPAPPAPEQEQPPGPPDQPSPKPKAEPKPKPKAEQPPGAPEGPARGRTWRGPSANAHSTLFAALFSVRRCQHCIVRCAARWSRRRFLAHGCRWSVLLMLVHKLEHCAP